MLSFSQEYEEKGLATTQTSLHKASPSQTEILPLCAAQPELLQSHSQNTLPETLPYHSRAIDFEQNTCELLQQQLQQLQHRFNGVHKLLIDHSEFQSALYQRKKGYKSVPIDPTSLNTDYSNKVTIINDIADLVEAIEQRVQEDAAGLGEAGDILETKFQQYYLERHYGALDCNFDSLSIQERSRCHSTEENGVSSLKEDEKCIISKIGHFQSLIPQSKITYSQEFCQTHQIDYEVTVPIPNIIQVEIPVVVYKVKDVMVRCDESEICGDMDDIIHKYSMPYQDLYCQAEGKQKTAMEEEVKSRFQLQVEEKEGKEASSCNQMLTPSVPSSNIHQGTQVQLAYSDFPEEDNLKLPLDSYAQIQSLISNSSRPNTDRSKSYLERDHQLETQAVFITQKVVSKSLIQKYEDNQRALLQQNIELKEYVIVLETQLAQNKKQNGYLSSQNDKLTKRLEEQIQQTQYYSQKLDELNAQLLEQKVLSLTHINQSKDRKIQMMNNQLQLKSLEIDNLNKQVEQIELHTKNSWGVIQRKQEEIAALSKMLEEKEQELTELTVCEDDVIEFASSTEVTLKGEIQKLQREKSQLRENLKFCQQRLQDDGISLHMDEARQIKGYIEQRQHNFNLEMAEVNKKYDQILATYQLELSDLKTQLQHLKNQTEWKNKAIEKQKQKEIESKKLSQKHCQQFEGIIDEYQKELEEKDDEIVTLKKKITQKEQIKGQFEVELIIQRAYHSIEVLEQQLKIQRAHKMQLSSQLLHLDKLIQEHLQSPPSKYDCESQLLQQLSAELERKMNQNCQLKQQVKSQSEQMAQLASNGRDEVMLAVREENTRLKKSNSKLKRYSEILEEDVKAICCMDQCDSHKNWIDRVTQERDYYMRMATQGAPDGLAC